MTTRFEWVKLILDNWKIVLSVVAFLSSSFLGVYTNIEKDEVIETTQKQVAQVAIQYQKEFKPEVPRETKPIVIREGCTQCLRQIKELKLKYHPE